MATETDKASRALPRQMQPQSYALMAEIEETHWWFVGRRRIIASFVERALAGWPADRARPRILDVGCGTGANLKMLAQFGQVEGVDLSEEALTFCRARGFINVRHGAVEQLPYEDSAFDLVTALDVIEHLDDDVAGLREMRRVLRPGGRALLFVPAFEFLWGVQDEVGHHRRRYRLPQLRRAVCEAGFAVERATYANFTFFAPILLGRALMRITPWQPASENEINISALNGLLGCLLGTERFWLRSRNFPFGVSALCVARRS